MKPRDTPHGPFPTAVMPRVGEVDPYERRSADHRVHAGLSSTTARLASGQLLSGRYRIERELGEGGMGVVYLATDEQVPGERFAIKVLKQQLHPEALTLLREEVRKTRKLSHQNVVDVHSVNVDGESLYVLMEYLEGKSLDALLNEEFGRGMPFSHAWPILKDIGAALSNAHDHNIIHSDIKPANIFVTTSGRTKLLDFGIARASRGPLFQDRSGGTRLLTPAYASCEMLEGKAADQRDDIYSFACVIYEMLCGQRPFGHVTALEARKAGTKVPPLKAFTRGQNAALSRALAFKREARTDTVENLLAGLAAAERNPLRGAAVVVAIAAVGLAYVALDRLLPSRHSLVVEGTALSTPQVAPTATVPKTALTPPPDSIAVLPFVNISGDSEQEYFADGLSEELIDHLAHSTDLKVIARTSSFQFKGKNQDVRSIARQLAVTHLLEGSVRKDGQQLRITAQLIRAADGVSLWSQTFNHPLVDIFKVQDQIAAQVSGALQVALVSGYGSGSHEPDIRAYNLVLQGDYLKARKTLGDLAKAVQLYQQAIDIDPHYALAWTQLASAYLNEEMLSGAPSATQSKRVIEALDRAAQIDPSLAWIYYTRAGYEMNIRWNWAAMQANDQRLREIDPRFELLPAVFGDIALLFGDVNHAIALYQDYLARNPLGSNTLRSLGDALCAAGQLEKCLQTRLRLMELHPEYDGINSSVGLAQLYLGDFTAAREAVLREPREDYRLRGLAVVDAASGQRAESDAALKTLEEKFASRDPYGIAEVHAYRGEIDDAFRWLDRAYREHDVGMLGFKTDPLLRSLQADSRFQALLSRMRLAEPQPVMRALGVEI